MTFEAVAPVLLSFARCSAFLSTFPLTSDKVVPPRLRAALALMLSLAVAPARPGGELFLALPGEVLLGCIAGFAGRLVFAGAEAGGQLMGLSLGLGFAGQFDPAMGDNELPTARIARTLAGLAFLACGGLGDSLRAVLGPTVSGPGLLGAGRVLVDEAGRVLIVGIRLAAPALAAGLVSNLAAAAASRAAPALNVFSVALALMFVVGATVLIATSPLAARELMLVGRRVAAVVAQASGGP